MSNLLFSELFESLISNGHKLLYAWDVIGCSFSFPIIEFLFAAIPEVREFYNSLLLFVGNLGDIPIIGDLLEGYYSWVLEDLLYFSMIDLAIYLPGLAIVVKLISKIWDALPVV